MYSSNHVSGIKFIRDKVSLFKHLELSVLILHYKIICIKFNFETSQGSHVPNYRNFFI